MSQSLWAVILGDTNVFEGIIEMQSSIFQGLDQTSFASGVAQFWLGTIENCVAPALPIK